MNLRLPVMPTDGRWKIDVPHPPSLRDSPIVTAHHLGLAPEAIGQCRSATTDALDVALT